MDAKRYHGKPCGHCGRTERYRSNRKCVHCSRFRHGSAPEPVSAEPAACEICGETSRRRRSLCVDHDHATGKPRGWLCEMCNLGVGNFRDDPALLRRAADYLEAHGALHKLLYG